MNAPVEPSTLIGLRELADLAERGDQAAKSELLRRISPGMLNTIRRKFGPFADDLDVVQEALLKLHSSLPPSDAQDIQCWANKVVRNIAIDMFRKRGRQKKRRESVDQRPSAQNETSMCHEQLERIERIERLRDHVNALSERDREILSLCYFEGLSIKESAKALGLNERMVRNRHDRARKRLAARLADDPYFSTK